MNENIARLTVELPHEMHKQVKLKAALTDQSMKEIIIKLIEGFLKE